MAVRGGCVAPRGVIVGGGYYDDGPGRLGVWLEHGPADFGVHPTSITRPAPPGHPGAGGVLRTGFTEAWLTAACSEGVTGVLAPTPELSLMPHRARARSGACSPPVGRGATTSTLSPSGSAREPRQRGQSDRQRGCARRRRKGLAMAPPTSSRISGISARSWASRP